MKKLFWMIIIVLFFPQNLWANIEFTNISVVSFDCTQSGEYQLVFKSNDDFWMEKSSTIDGVFILNIRFNPNCVTQLLQSEDIEKEKELFLDAIKELENQLAISKNIVLGLKSGKGCHPVPCKKGEYQSDDLRILEYKGIKRIYAIHADTGSGYCSGNSDEGGELGGTD